MHGLPVQVVPVGLSIGTLPLSEQVVKESHVGLDGAAGVKKIRNGKENRKKEGRKYYVVRRDAI